MLVLTSMEGGSGAMSSEPREMVQRESTARRSRRSKSVALPLMAASELGSFQGGPLLKMPFSASNSYSPTRISELQWYMAALGSQFYRFYMSYKQRLQPITDFIHILRAINCMIILPFSIIFASSNTTQKALRWIALFLEESSSGLSYLYIAGLVDNLNWFLTIDHLMGDCVSRQTELNQRAERLPSSPQENKGMQGESSRNNRVLVFDKCDVVQKQNKDSKYQNKPKDNVMRNGTASSQEASNKMKDDAVEMKKIIQDLIKKSKNGLITLKDKDQGTQAAVECFQAVPDEGVNNFRGDPLSLPFTIKAS